MISATPEFIGRISGLNARSGKSAPENGPRKMPRLAYDGSTNTDNSADRWDEFLESWKWSQALPYAPERRPGLWGAFDLMDAKTRFDTYSEARKRSYRDDSGIGTVVPFPLAKRHLAGMGNPIRLTQTATLLHGDVTRHDGRACRQTPRLIWQSPMFRILSEGRPKPVPQRLHPSERHEGAFQ